MQIHAVLCLAQLLVCALGSLLVLHTALLGIFRPMWWADLPGRCRRETHCEFCDCQLPDWKHILTPRCGANAPAVMNVNFDGQTYSFEVKPGPDGYKKFTDAIRRAFTLPDDSELNITFTCDEPGVGTCHLPSKAAVSRKLRWSTVLSC